jgi:hypothetical protein
MKPASVKFILECSAGSIASISGLRENDEISRFTRWVWDHQEAIPDTEPNLTAVQSAWDCYVEHHRTTPQLSELQKHTVDCFSFILPWNGQFTGETFASEIRKTYDNERARECANAVDVPYLVLTRRNGATLCSLRAAEPAA